MNTFEIEIREQAGREPTLYGVMMQEGRAATGGRAELFAPGAVEWPSQGVGVLTEHLGEIETRAQVIRERDGRLTLTARATEGDQESGCAGQAFHVRSNSLHFGNGATKAGVREILRAFVDKAALVARPE